MCHFLKKLREAVTKENASGEKEVIIKNAAGILTVGKLG